MERRATWLVIASLLIAGCNSSDSPTPTGAPSAAAPATGPAVTPALNQTTPGATQAANPPNPADIAAATDVARRFLDAVVQGDTNAANTLLTPLAVQRLKESGKPFQLPGLNNYQFRIGQVRMPSPNQAFVQCMGVDRTAPQPAPEEEFCWLMSNTEAGWKIAGVSFSAGQQNTLMIFSFEDPDKGPIPVQQLVNHAKGQTAAAQQPAGTAPQQTAAQQQPAYTLPSPQQAPAYAPPTQPYTAQPEPQQNYR
jgi:hypothetical protein